MSSIRPLLVTESDADIQNNPKHETTEYPELEAVKAESDFSTAAHRIRSVTSDTSAASGAGVKKKSMRRLWSLAARWQSALYSLRLVPSSVTCGLRRFAGAGASVHFSDAATHWRWPHPGFGTSADLRAPAPAMWSYMGC